MGSKSKKRVILPTRPDPPSVEQIVEDVNRAFPNDPVFSILQDSLQVPDAKAGSTDSMVESRYQQSRRYLELYERLQRARGDLSGKREELRATGEQLESCVAEIKGRAL